MALEHGKRYTQVTYVYPSTTVNAPSQNWPETFIFEHGHGEFRPGSPGAVDQLTIGLAHITVQPGWLYREVMDGVYDTSGTKPVFKEPSSVVPFPKNNPHVIYAATPPAPDAAPTPTSPPTT